MTDPDLPQPGWYPDPSGAPALRWWNGVTWGDATRKRWWIPAVALVALLGLAAVAFSALVGGLGGPRRLDTDAVERRIAAELTQQFGRPITVTCPKGVALQAGNVFTCMASDDEGDRALISVRQKNDRGDVEWVRQ